MAPSKPNSPCQRKSRRVTAQHTLERVRNNQRRHRARQRDYIATLEEKLSFADETITTLREEIDALRAELTQFRDQVGGQFVGSPVTTVEPRRDDGSTSTLPPPPPTSSFSEMNFQLSGLLQNNTNYDMIPFSVFSPTHHQLSSDLPVGLDPNAISLFARLEDAGYSTEFEDTQALAPLAPLAHDYVPEIPSAVIPVPIDIGRTSCSGSCNASNVIAQTMNQLAGSSVTFFSATASPDTTATQTCCSDRRSSMTYANGTVESAMGLDGENSASLPATIAQLTPEAESTMLCAEAYLLIEQQNFKGVSHADVATWLSHGYRRSIRGSKGCRVSTALVFSLLTFISDVR